MSQQSRQTFDRLYGDAQAPEDLPWNHTTPSDFLEQVVAARPDGGRALDLGCGSGADTVYLAQHGWQVTSLDFMPQAVEMTRKRAEAAGVTVDVQVADITTWPGDGTFDLIVDAGCLHALGMADRPAYRRQLLQWLAIGGVYVLRHAERRHVFERRRMGPKRVSRRRIKKLFAPELVERDFHRNLITSARYPSGPGFTHTSYWFEDRRG